VPEKASLFDEFQPVASKAWKQQIQFELKGADYNDTLVWDSPDGIRVKPFYHIDEDAVENAVPSKKGGFSICQEIFVFDVAKSATRALDSIQRGANGIRFILPDDTCDVSQLLRDFPFGDADASFRMEFAPEAVLQKLQEIAVSNGVVLQCDIDPIRHLTKDGNWYTALGDNFQWLSAQTAKFPNLSLLSIDATGYQNAGATPVQQLAYTLAHLNEYFERIVDDGKSPTFHVAVGPNYFFEIAKIRAFRMLYASLAELHGRPSECRIAATPTRRNKTIYDYNVNMLRTTTECMAAIAGGADIVTNLPYDALYHKSNEFGERIARNQLLILKNESHFDITANPADGSYYIENLTAQLAEKALALFKEIEANGGLIAQLKDGTIQRKIRESADKEQTAFDSGSEILVGTNKYPNKTDRMKDDLQLYPFVKTQPRKTLITPLIEKRLAEKSEQERLSTES